MASLYNLKSVMGGSQDVAGRFVDWNFYSYHTSGDARSLYCRLYLSGAAGDGEALRAFTTINNVSAGMAHGVHGSLNFGSTGRVTGLGVAIHGTLHIPDDASWAPGTISALCAEIYSDGDASDTDGATDVSFIRVANSGNANGVADVEDDAALMSFAGFTIGSGNMLAAKSAAAVTHVIRIKVGSTPYYLMVSDQI